MNPRATISRNFARFKPPSFRFQCGILKIYPSIYLTVRAFYFTPPSKDRDFQVSPSVHRSPRTPLLYARFPSLLLSLVYGLITMNLLKSEQFHYALTKLFRLVADHVRSTA